MTIENKIYPVYNHILWSNKLAFKSVIYSLKGAQLFVCFPSGTNSNDQCTIEAESTDHDIA